MKPVMQAEKDERHRRRLATAIRPERPPARPASIEEIVGAWFFGPAHDRDKARMLDTVLRR